MRYKSTLSLLILISAAFFFPHLALADNAQGEVQLIVDFVDGHEVTVFLPEQSNPTSLVAAIEGILNTRLQLQESWLDAEGGEVWLYSSPGLLPRFGLTKQVQWDLSPLLSASAQTGLDRLDAFLVVGTAGGLLNFDVAVNDQHGPAELSGIDGWEMWWGFGLTPGGSAPDLFTSIMLRVDWSPISWLPVLIPLAAALLLLLLGNRLSLAAFHRVSKLLYFCSLLAGLFAAYLMNWHGMLSYLGLTAAGSWSSVMLVAVLLSFWTQVTIGLPASRIAARLAGQAWTLKAYLHRTRLLALVLLVLLGSGAILGLTTALLAGVSVWLALGFLLLTSALVLWWLNYLILHLAYRARRWDEPEATQLVEQLARAFQIAPPKLYLVENKKAGFANAYAVGHRSPRIYVTEMLWERLDEAECRFIMAHELAHLKLGHVPKIYLGMLIPLWLVVLSVASFLWTASLWLPLLALAAAYLVNFLIALPNRRNYELAADQLAVQLTGDADAAAAALLALQAANRGFRTNTRTHPAIAARVEALRGSSISPWTDITSMERRS